MDTGRVSIPMVRAIALALVLHGLAMVTAGHYLPRRPLVVPPTITQKQAAVPMAIEFLLPPPAPAEQVAVPKLIPTQIRAKAIRLSKNSIAGRTSQQEPAAEKSTAKNPQLPATGLGMRRQGAPAHTVPSLNTRLAPAHTKYGKPQLGPRADLIATGPATVRHDSSPWSPTGGGSMRADKEPFHAEIRSDGRIEFRDRPNVQIEGIKISEEYLIPVIAGRFDVTDAIMASLGETLYPYRKRKLMDESREMRAGMAKADHEYQLKKALKNYNRHLRWLWKQETLTIRDRKKALFALWDECAEEGSASVLATARSVRAKTIAFVRKKLPKGSRHSYSTAELNALNDRRQSSEYFLPY